MKSIAVVDKRDPCGMAFKEWAGICQALESGRQSIIIRKGGIAESRGRFVPEYSRFWLFPTYTHQQEQGLREPAPAPAGEHAISIQSLAVVEQVWRLESPDAALALEPFHIWTETTVLSRFQYRTPGLWLLFARLFRLPEPVEIAQRPEFQGCHSWVPLPEPISVDGLIPVLSDANHRTTLEAITKTLAAFQPGDSDD